jgi:micrococcal nuclease
MAEILFVQAVVFVLGVLVGIKSVRTRHIYPRVYIESSAERGKIGRLPRVKLNFIADGDTLTVSTRWQQLKVRLLSIDCPEDGQSYGDIASYGLMKMLRHKDIRLEHIGYDVHGRVLGNLYIYDNSKQQWLCVNERMVMLGHAWFYRAYSDHLSPTQWNRYANLQAWAQTRRMGLWAVDNPTSPWEWRKTQAATNPKAAPFMQ